MKRVILVILLLAVVGVGVGYILRPSEGEVNYMLYKEQVDDRYGDVESHYRARLEAGEITAEVVAPLKKLYLESAAVDKAVEVLELYVENHPDDMKALNELGELYQYAQRPDDYLKVLERINERDSNPEVLKKLSDIYNFSGDYNKQAEVLSQLEGQQTELSGEQVVELARVFAATDRPDEAIAALEHLREKDATLFTFEAEELMVNLLLDADRKQDAYASVLKWKENNGTPEQVARLASILRYKGDVASAQSILDSYGDELYTSTPLIVEQVYLHSFTGEDERAYSLLSQLDEQNVLPDDLRPVYLILALKRGETNVATRLYDSLTPNTNEADAIILTEMAVVEKRRSLLNEVDSRLGGEDYRNSHQLFDIVLGLAKREESVDSKIERYKTSEVVTDAQKMVIARNCMYVGKKTCARDFLTEFTNRETFTENDVISAGELYLTMRDYNDGLSFINKHRTADSSERVEKVWVRMSAATGKTDEVRAWLSAREDSATVTDSLLTDLYFMSADNRHYGLATSVAERLFARSPTPITRGYLSNGYIKMGRFSEALKLLEQNSGMSAKDADNYLSALIAQAGRDPSYRKELGRFAASQLSKPMSEQRRLTLIYALIDAGRLDVAMPYVKQYALKEGGDWVYLYAENLERQGKVAEAREFWVRLAQQPGVSHEERRNIAYALLEKGYKSDAEKLFSSLAANKAPTSVEVRQLLYIWGPRLNESQMSWVYNRSNTATNDVERAQWLKILADYSSPETLVGFVDRHEELAYSSAVMTPYMQGQYDLGNRKAIAAMLPRIQEKRMAPEAVRQYARFASDSGLNREAESAYKLLHNAVPNDREALREIGVSSYNLAYYSQAEQYLGEYLNEYRDQPAFDNEAYLSYFYYAELLRRDHQTKEAKRYYDAVRHLVSEAPVKTADMRAKAATSLIFSGQQEEGLAEFNTAVAAYPKDKVLKADLISALVETKRYDEARAMLSQEDVAKPTAGGKAVQGKALRLDGAAGLKAYKVLGGERELLIATNPNPRAAAATKRFADSLPLSHPWVSYAAQGYDKLLVVAKPEWQLRVANGRDGSLMVVPTESGEQSSAAFEAQRYLRNQLTHARIDLESGDHNDAIDRLNALKDTYSSDAQYLGYLANAENFAGRWPRSLKLLREAQALAPENEDIAELKRGIDKLHAQHIKLDHEWRGLGDNDEQITTLSGFATIADGWDLGLVARNNQVDSTTVRRADGRLGRFKSDRQDGELFVRRTEDDGDMYKASLFANNDTLGAGLYYSFVNRLGQTGFDVEYHRPYREFVEGVLDDATRDRIAVHHLHRLDARSSLAGGLGVNRYNVDSGEDVASSVSVNANYSRQIFDSPEIAVLYGFDAEYELDHEERSNANSGGANYRPFPFRSREVHSLSLAGKHHLTRRTNVEWLGGYAFDRLGGHGPIAEGRFTHEITDDLEFQARASIGIGNGETDDDLKRVGAYLMYRY